MIVMQILLETTLDTLALISFPDFDFHMGRNQPFVRKLNDSAKSFLFDRFEEELEHFPFSSHNVKCASNSSKNPL